jgi:hypothetical protein
MKIGANQPYLFPYLGYFQLINIVDIFVIVDDVQYIQRGWINRNKILQENKDFLFTFNVERDSFTKLINQRFYSDVTFEKTKEKFLKTIIYSYKKAPCFSEVYDLLSEILNYRSLNVAEFNTNSLKNLCQFMGINTKFLISSSLEKNNELKSQELAIEINRVLGSDNYVNSIGGIDLYSQDAFQKQGITLKFIKMKDIKYPQYGSEFVPSLSIIDVLMFNSKDTLERLLNEYELI